MAITSKERWTSPRTRDDIGGKNDRAFISHVIEGDNGEGEAAIRAWALNNLAATYEGLWRRSIEVERTESDGVWDVRATYESPAVNFPSVNIPPGTNTTVWGIRTAGGGVVKRFYSEEFIDERAEDVKYEWAGFATEITQAVGLTSDGQGQLKSVGVDQQVGQIEVWVKTVYSAAQVTGGALITAAEQAALHSVNNATWEIFPARTLKIDSFSATKRNDGNYNIDYTFQYSPAITLTLIDNKPSITKQGHHHLEVVMRPKAIQPNGLLKLTTPFIARVATHRLYPEINFTTELLL